MLPQPSLETQIFGVFEAYVEILESNWLFGRSFLSLNEHRTQVKLDWRKPKVSHWLKLVHIAVALILPTGGVVARFIINKAGWGRLADNIPPSLIIFYTAMAVLILGLSAMFAPSVFKSKEFLGMQNYMKQVFQSLAQGKITLSRVRGQESYQLFILTQVAPGRKMATNLARISSSLHRFFSGFTLSSQSH